MRFVNVEDTVWPVDEDGEVQWRLRYGFDRRDGDLSAASVMAAYAFLTDPNRTLKDATASLRRARAAVQKTRAEEAMTVIPSGVVPPLTSSLH